MRGGFSAAGVGIVFDVVVNEACRMDEFDQRNKSVGALYKIGLMLPAIAGGFGAQNHKQRPPAFSARLDQGSARFGKGFDVPCAYRLIRRSER